MYSIGYFLVFLFLVGLSSGQKICIENSRKLTAQPISGYEIANPSNTCFTIECPVPTKGRKRSIIIPLKNNICVDFNDESQQVFENTNDIIAFTCWKRNTISDFNAVRAYYCARDPTV